MDISILFNYLAGLNPVIPIGLGIAGGIVMLAQGVVLLTPSKKDDEAWAKIKAVPILGAALDALTAFAPFKKK